MHLCAKLFCMQLKWIVPVSISFSLLAACGGNQDHSHHEGGKSMNEAAPPAMSANDSLFEEVVALHDEAMPKISKVKGYIKDLEAKIDSLSARKDAASKALLADYNNLLAGLKRADKGMFDWMDAFDPEIKDASEDSIKNYYTAEKAKAKAMRDDIFNMLDSAAAKLKY